VQGKSLEDSKVKICSGDIIRLKSLTKFDNRLFYGEIEGNIDVILQVLGQAFADGKNVLIEAGSYDPVEYPISVDVILLTQDQQRTLIIDIHFQNMADEEYMPAEWAISIAEEEAGPIDDDMIERASKILGKFQDVFSRFIDIEHLRRVIPKRVSLKISFEPHDRATIYPTLMLICICKDEKDLREKALGILNRDTISEIVGIFSKADESYSEFVIKVLKDMIEHRSS